MHFDIFQCDREEGKDADKVAYPRNQARKQNLSEVLLPKFVKQDADEFLIVDLVAV